MPKARAKTLLALLLLAAAAQTAAGRQDEAGAPQRLSFPGKDWALDFTAPPAADAPGAAAAKDAPRLLAEPTETWSDDGREFQTTFFVGFGKKAPSAFRIVTVTLSPARAAGGPEEFRAFILQKLSKGGAAQGVKTWGRGQVPVAGYRLDYARLLKLPPSPAVPAYGGVMRVTQAFLVKDGVWVSVSLSASESGEREQAFFHSLLDSVRFTDTSAPSTSFDFYHRGRPLHAVKDYRRAAEALASALELERRGRRLGARAWGDPVARLVDSYNATREPERAKEALDYGVGADPANLIFNLALARYHARRDDLENTIAHLERAFQHRVKLPGGVRLFDPATDPAFERFRDNKRFRETLKKQKK